MTSLRETLQGALVMAPMTRGSNLPYRQLCQELGARVTMSEMAVARRLKQKRRSEFALIRRAPAERFFGVQLAGNKAEEMAWAAELAVARGADLVDVNLGCPIDYFTSKGLGAALAREPRRVRKIVEAMKLAVRQIPVTVKIRLGWNDEHRNYLEVARAAVDGGADAVFVHGRTRAARYTMSADWNAIGEIAAALPVPVIGNGDLLFRHEIDAGLASGCTAVMAARGALIKPWLFREATEGDADPSGEDRVAIYRRYVTLAKAHWGADEYGVGRIREFLLWHLGFWCRYAPRRPDGTYPTMQQRESWTPRTPLEALLARSDAAAHEYLAGRLIAEESIDAAAAPGPTAAREMDDDKAEAG
jgi:tRNA-dihydrouridine synthase 3